MVSLLRVPSRGVPGPAVGARGGRAGAGKRIREATRGGRKARKAKEGQGGGKFEKRKFTNVETCLCFREEPGYDDY